MHTLSFFLDLYTNPWVGNSSQREDWKTGRNRWTILGKCSKNAKIGWEIRNFGHNFYSLNLSRQEESKKENNEEHATRKSSKKNTNN